MSETALTRRRRLTDIAFALATGLLTALAMPGMGPGALSWGIYVALVPMLWVALEASPKRAFLLGWLSGTVGFFVAMSWVADTVHTFGALPYVLAYPIALLLAAYLGLYTGLFALGCRFLFGRRVPLVLAAPVLWVSLEFLRTHLVTGMPWNPLGLALVDALRIIQLADVTGIYGVSWFIVLVNICLFTLLAPFFGRHPGRRQSFFFNHALILLIVPISVAAYGQVQIASFSLQHQQNPSPNGPIKVALVQPNIPQDIKWNPSQLENTFQRLERLTMGTAEFAPDLVIWPEASAPLVLDRDPYAERRIAAMARSLDANLMVGTLSSAKDGAVRNSVLLFGPDGNIKDSAHKTHLVPFGEYVPLEKFLPFVRALTDGIGNVLPGEEPVQLTMERRGQQIKAALAVCYEIIFPNLVRKRMADADFIVTVTNDAWFGSSAALSQHFAQAVFRAVENRTYVVRAANTGITGMIDPYGIPQNLAAINTEAVVHASIDVKLGATVYSTYGDMFAIGSGILTLLLFVYAGLRTGRSIRRAERQDEDIYY
jgi:apolipoprotein N-acyltransferase